ncbi:uncharacterized protein MYCFIDRAFT_194957 [Pseudocercospora fijiensis CIRAD86]|uniref:Uncharacterized protein n=1 Tax=Pseudocercospora fijiensis (strain CIRAD86) TaxID=383855 RepID=M2ZB52_PSEFD|nr:uncharacterized protein MYCFIDRAFT_194957 [Pseudocercospora fijiensis CIRAD86]EME87085.1 hypothetical protein MYCFIDRAFT_194957 [Pseudocercospora fijiensis CIRAD86]
MASTQNPFDDPPPYSDTSSRVSDLDDFEENHNQITEVRDATEPAQATQATTETIKMASTQDPFDHLPPCSNASSWVSDLDDFEETDNQITKVRDAPEPAQATRAITELKQGPETEKLREFLLFVIFRDYVGLWCQSGCYTLRDSTRDHFLRIAETMERASYLIKATSIPGQPARVTGASHDGGREGYLWRNIYEPCRFLGLPQDAIAATIMRFYHYRRSFCPRYSGCIPQVVSKEGMRSLARKIAIDREVIMKCLFGYEYGLRQSAIKSGLRQVEKRYFILLKAKNAQDLPFTWWYWSKNGGRSFEQSFRIIYQLSARGVEAENRRLQKAVVLSSKSRCG